MQSAVLKERLSISTILCQLLQYVMLDRDLHTNVQFQIDGVDSQLLPSCSESMSFQIILLSLRPKSVLTYTGMAVALDLPVVRNAVLRSVWRG